MTKRIRFTEQTNLQLFAEAFNILNRFNKTTVNTGEFSVTGVCPATCVLTPNNTGTTAFGLPRSGFNALNGARIVQLVAKFVF
jgi:hypothetical protein